MNQNNLPVQGPNVRIIKNPYDFYSLRPPLTDGKLEAFEVLKQQVSREKKEKTSSLKQLQTRLKSKMFNHMRPLLTIILPHHFNITDNAICCLLVFTLGVVFALLLVIWFFYNMTKHRLYPKQA